MIENLGDEKIKVPKSFNEFFARPTDIEVYDEEQKDYKETGYSFDGATCLKIKQCLGKMTFLSKGESKIYNVNVVPGRVSSAFKKGKKYRFKLAFDTYLFTGCTDYTTGWLYYET